MPKTKQEFEIVVIGAGIAGASVAAELSAEASVLLLEQESQPGYHTTGRSAAVFSPIYGPQPIRALTRAALDFFISPPAGFADHPLLSPVGAVIVARADQLDRLDEMHAELADAQAVTCIEQAELQVRLPILREGYGVRALWDTGSSEIDVAALHQGYLRQFRARGGETRTNAAVTELKREGAVWRVQTPQGEITAKTIVNAAGAWADEVGQMADAERIGLVPKRRTALMVDGPQGYEIDSLPLIVDVDEQFYLKADAGKLLISPANEDPEPPCDVRPDEMDIAVCVDRIERAFDVQIRRVESPWAGLRSFVADKCPVAGFSQQAEGFYWLAAQGGYGIQSAPSLAQFAAAEVMGRPIPPHILAERLNPDTIRPEREGVGS